MFPRHTKHAPPPLTKTRLENLALRYITRYAASEAMLSRVLRNHIRKALHHDPHFDKSEAELWHVAILEKYKTNGWLNDAALTERWIEGGLKAGRSRQKLKLTLQKKGIARALIEDKIAEHAHDEDDWNAALIFAERRHLGPYADKGGKKKESDPQKDLRKLCRAGFSLEIARRVLRYSDDDVGAGGGGAGGAED